MNTLPALIADQKLKIEQEASKVLVQERQRRQVESNYFEQVVKQIEDKIQQYYSMHQSYLGQIDEIQQKVLKQQ